MIPLLKQNKIKPLSLKSMGRHRGRSNAGIESPPLNYGNICDTDTSELVHMLHNRENQGRP